ncbi:MAG: glycosyltransferase family 4 protein [Patescibacteria group bacterium]
MKRILIFSLAYYPFVGGDGVAIKEITKRISPQEIEFHMVTLRFDSTLPKFEQIGNVAVHRIGWSYKKPTSEAMRKLRYRLIKLWFQFAAAFYGMSLNRKEKFDAVWSMMAHSAGVPGALFKFFHPNVGFILTLQEGDPPEHVERVMRPLWLLFTRAFTSADIVQAISTFLGTWARRRGFKGPLEIIPNGADIKYFSQLVSEEVLEAYKNKLGKKEKDVYLITTSRLVYKNAVDDVIRALPLLPAEVQFLILGIGSEEESLKKLAHELGVEKRITFLGYVAHEDMLPYLKISDVFIRASRSEGQGASFMETMAAGLPVIATQEGGIADFLFDAKRNPDKPTTGWAVDKDAPEQIAKAVEEILGNPTQTAEVIQNARDLVAKSYNWDLIAKNMQEKIFNRVFKTTLQ